MTEAQFRRLAAGIAGDLRGLLAPWVFASTRQSEACALRSTLAQAMAERETGVTLAQAALMRTASAAELSRDMVDGCLAYNAALVRAYRSLPQRIDLLLPVVESLAGERAREAA